MDEVTQIFKEDFGSPPSALFASFEPRPFAAASLAQVHRATGLDGRPMAVKVQYIDMADRFEGDLSTAEFLMRAATLLHPDFDFAWTMREARHELERELDFINEARNSEKCLDDLEHLGFVAVPQVDWTLVSRRVLTAEYIDGVKITDLEGLQRLGVSKAEAATMLHKALATQIFSSGFIHADPHPGLRERERARGAFSSCAPQSVSTSPVQGTL